MRRLRRDLKSSMPRRRYICTSFTNLQSNPRRRFAPCADPPAGWVSENAVMKATRARKPTAVMALMLSAFLLPRIAGAAEAVEVVLDQATLMKLPDKVSTIVVGNPTIADIALQSGGLMVVT